MPEPLKVRINDELIERIDDFRTNLEDRGYGLVARERMIADLLTDALDMREEELKTIDAAVAAQRKTRKR